MRAAARISPGRRELDRVVDQVPEDAAQLHAIGPERERRVDGRARAARAPSPPRPGAGACIPRPASRRARTRSRGARSAPCRSGSGRAPRRRAPPAPWRSPAGLPPARECGAASAGFVAVRLMSSARSRIAFAGVRMSCDTAERKRVLRTLASSASRRRSSSSRSSCLRAADVHDDGHAPGEASRPRRRSGRRSRPW